MIDVLYFAWIKSKTGLSREEVSADGIQTITDLMEALKAHSPGHAEAFAEISVVRAALNQEHVPLNSPVKDGDEVAFFPPVTGG